MYAVILEGKIFDRLEKKFSKNFEFQWNFPYLISIFKYDEMREKEIEYF